MGIEPTTSSLRKLALIVRSQCLSCKTRVYAGSANSKTCLSTVKRIFEFEALLALPMSFGQDPWCRPEDCLVPIFLSLFFKVAARPTGPTHCLFERILTSAPRQIPGRHIVYVTAAFFLRLALSALRSLGRLSPSRCKVAGIEHRRGGGAYPVQNC